MFGRVNRGKSRKHGIRPPVDLAAPRTLFGQVDVAGRYIKSWVRMAKVVKPVPDFGPWDLDLDRGAPLSDGTLPMSRPMSYQRFLRILQGVLLAGGFSWDIIQKITTDSFRRL